MGGGCLGFQRGAVWFEFRALTAWGKKLLSSLAERALILRYRLPEGRSWKRLWEGWVGSSTILFALLEHRVRKISRMEGRGAPMIFAAVFTVRWYSAFYVLLYTQSASQSCGGGLSSTTTSVQHPLGWCDGCHRTTCSPHTSYRWRGERVIEPIKCIGIIRRPWLTRASGGNLARTPGLHPYSLREVPWHF